MRAAIAAVLVIALPAAAADLDGGYPGAIYAERAQLLIPDAGWFDTEGPGGWLPVASLVTEEKKHAELRAENAKLMTSPEIFSRWGLIFAGVLTTIALLGGIWLGWKLHDLVR